MSKKSDLIKLEFILKLIEDIESIIKRHNGIENSLLDFEGQHAILMCLMQIGENLNAIKTEDLREVLPISLAYKMRNVIAHHYDGIDIAKIEITINENIPELKQDINVIFGRETKNII